MKPISGSRVVLVAATAMLVLAACTPNSGSLVPIPTDTPTAFPGPAHNGTLSKLADILASGGQPAQDALISCLLNYDQGLPVNYRGQGLLLGPATDECSVKLVEAGEQGFGGFPNEPSGPAGSFGGGNLFDPGTITASCNSGDPGRASGLSDLIAEAHRKHEDFLGQDASRRAAGALYVLAKEDPNAPPDAAANAEALFRNLQDSTRKAAVAFTIASAVLKGALITGATAPPSVPAGGTAGSGGTGGTTEPGATHEPSGTGGTGGSSGTSGTGGTHEPSGPGGTGVHQPGGQSACTEALQKARELLFECNRTEWKSYECRQLQAKMNNCPDPALIMVDPEQGYTCGQKPDPATLKAAVDAWMLRCEELKRFDPSGPNPCEPPQIDPSGLIGNGKIGDVCNDPRAYVDPDNNDCVATLTITPPFGEPNLKQIAVWGLNKLGGPIIVLPPKGGGDSPEPGPGPRPTP